jgi:hypothetical protein
MTPLPNVINRERRHYISPSVTDGSPILARIHGVLGGRQAQSPTLGVGMKLSRFTQITDFRNDSRRKSKVGALVPGGPLL